jgi:hypothetical protein
MVLPYNLTNFSNSATIGDVLISANQFSGGISGGGILFLMLSLLVFFVVLVSLKGYGFKYALLASSFVSFLTSLFLFVAGVLGLYWVLLWGVTWALSLFVAYLFREG